MEERVRSTAWLSWLSFIAGLWLIVSPFILGYSGRGAATTNDVLVGLVVAVASFIAAVWGKALGSPFSWIIALGGAWEIVAPFLLGYTDEGTALGNAVVLGILIVVLSGSRGLLLSQAGLRREYGPTFYAREKPEKEEKEG